ncbi:hypothetical protein BC834DRAFT_973240, partial [Gloeopeniophorella convolvens]
MQRSFFPPPSFPHPSAIPGRSMHPLTPPPPASPSPSPSPSPPPHSLPAGHTDPARTRPLRPRSARWAPFPPFQQRSRRQHGMSPGSSPKAQLGAASKNYCPPSPAAVTAANQTNQVHKVSKKYNMKGDVGPEAAVKKAKREKKVTVAEEIESASKDAALEEPSDNEPAALEVEFEKEKWRKDKKIFKKSNRRRKAPHTIHAHTRIRLPADTEASFETSSISVHLPPSAPPHLPPAFDALAVPVASSGAFPGFSGPTPVQPCAWPPALTGRDIIGIAETGSGNALV